MKVTDLTQQLKVLETKYEQLLEMWVELEG